MVCPVAAERARQGNPNRRGETMSFRKIVPAKHTPKKPVRKPVKR